MKLGVKLKAGDVGTRDSADTGLGARLLYSESLCTCVSNRIKVYSCFGVKILTEGDKAGLRLLARPFHREDRD